MTLSPTRAREPAVPVRFARAALKHATRCGVDAEALLTGSGIAPALLRQDGARITSAAFAGLLTRAMLAMDDEGLGFYRRPIPVGSWSMMCFAGTNTRLLRTALDRYCRFLCLLDVGLMPALLDVDGRAVLRFRKSDPAWREDRFVSESMLVTVHRFTSWLLQEHVPLAWVSLPHPRPPDVDEYRSLFLGAAMRFEQPCAELAFGQHFLDQPLRQDGQSLRRFLEAPLLALLTTRYRTTSWTTRGEAAPRRGRAARRAEHGEHRRAAAHPSPVAPPAARRGGNLVQAGGRRRAARGGDLPPGKVERDDGEK